MDELQRIGGVWIDRLVARSLDAGSSAQAWAELSLRLSGDANLPRRKLKDDPSRSLLELVELDGRRWTVKRYRLRPLKAWLWRVARRTPAWRELAGAAKLRALGRRCNPPLALVDGVEQALVFPYVEGVALHHVAADPSVSAAVRLDLARRVGTQIGLLLAAGVVNRDHKLSNLIMDGRCAHEGAEPVIIDPLGLRMFRGERQVRKLLAMLLRTTRRDGTVTTREGLACVKALLAAAPPIARGKPGVLKRLAQAAAADA